jgi:hypothetical protein
MKSTFFLSFLTALSSQAALIHFDLSPAGTDVAVGLSPSNQVPAVTNSTGSGNTISDGIIFNTDTYNLQVAIGYGSAAGFTDLTGTPIAMHIHSPATTGQNASPLVNLSPYDFPAATPTKGGVIYGNIAFPTNAVSNLLAGLNYVNIHTALNPGGEIRGQLIPQVATNSPPQVSCPSPATVECGAPAQVTVAVADPDGDALTVVWSLNGQVVATNSLSAGSSSNQVSVSFSATMPLGTNLVSVMVTDTANTASCSTTVLVVDTMPPTIVKAGASPNVLWPPNHKWVNVRISATVEDPCDTTMWKIIKVSSNEPANGNGHGHGQEGVQWQITGDHTLKLLAERLGNGSGRIYTITIQATDASGNVSEPVDVTVTVPHSNGS